MKNRFLVLGVLLVASIVAICGCTSDGGQSNVKVENLAVNSMGYGSYEVTGTITPTQDISYIEMVLKWYDAQGNVIERSPLAWNINDAKAGQTIKFTANSYIQSGTPAKVDILIFDSPFAGGDDTGAIYKTTINV